MNSAGHLVTSWQTSPGGNWTGWVDWSAAGGLLGGTTFTPNSWVGVGHGPDGSMEIYLIDKSGQLVTMWQTRPGGTWTTLKSLGASGFAPGAAIGVGVAANKEQELYLVNASGALQTMWQTAPGGSWTGLVPLNNITGLGGGAPVGVGYGPAGVMEIYLVNPAGQLMTMWQVAPNGSWTGLQQLNGIGGLTPATPIGLGSGPGGVQELYFVNAAGKLETAWQTAPGGNWTNLVNLNGMSGLQPQAPIGVGKGPDGSQEIYLVNKGTLQTMWQKGPGASWTGWTATGAPWGTTYNG